MNAPIRLKDPSVSSKQYTFSLSFGGMAALVTVFTLALCLFFVLGVLVGRGHRPETAVPVVAGIMPKEVLTRQAPPPEVLKAEELGYSEQLGKKHDGPVPSRAIDSVEQKPREKKVEKKEEPKPAAKTPEKPAASTQDKPTQKKDEKKPADKATAEKKAEQKSAQKPDPDSQRYDYAYQAATFPDADSAKAYLKRVKGLGLKGDIESGNTEGKNWHRVVVFFQGTPTDTRSLKEKLASIGAQKLVMRSKTPAH